MLQAGDSLVLPMPDGYRFEAESFAVSLVDTLCTCMLMIVLKDASIGDFSAFSTPRGESIQTCMTQIITCSPSWLTVFCHDSFFGKGGPYRSLESSW